MSGLDPGFGPAAEVLARLRGTTGDLGAVLAELESAVEPGVADWPVEAQARYRAAKREWTAALELMPGCLDRAAEAFREIAAEEPDIGS
ncbi:WXG100 family type VII secretion target [Amycolatopsis benzoatilytica]|uniref:WXG100 family type VII secretion target n=1 Tax=Amycolatopsis benzoatilytica TaxID=346045 RepID=UPI000481A698|nr:hypothetical protein [Amycolatopsis benzoatilytica]